MAPIVQRQQAEIESLSAAVLATTQAEVYKRQLQENEVIGKGTELGLQRLGGMTESHKHSFAGFLEKRGDLVTGDYETPEPVADEIVRAGQVYVREVVEPERTRQKRARVDNEIAEMHGAIQGWEYGR